MKNVTITQFTHAEAEAPQEQFGYLKIPTEHKKIRAEGENIVVSDGYHTFDELYDHRIALYIALCKHMHELLGMENPEKFKVWRSVKHSDGELAFGGTWFVLGIGTGKGKQITYHLPIEMWEDTLFAETLDKAPEWDGHSSADVLERIKQL